MEQVLRQETGIKTFLTLVLFVNVTRYKTVIFVGLGVISSILKKLAIPETFSGIEQRSCSVAS